MATRTPSALAKWGNSTALRIPRKIAEQAELHEGDEVDFEVEAPGVIIVRALKNRPTLESLVSRITRKNRHSETEWGKPRGEEVW
ncbi:MAG: AbrB/MazE/SpoVT family DNA-binding domain-containing protein [Acidobacteriaceae bacterium]|nr:AbrB/MazE/SpoVT family DNA-binding domain-containing protein [Acidobacteriaceae bacterium]